MSRKWDELTEAEQLATIYSDLHKDYYGFRPRGLTYDQVQSVKWLSAAINRLERLNQDEPDGQ